MKRKLLYILTLLCLMVQGAWADAIKTEEQLTKAIADGETNISLDADIQLSKYLDIDGVTVTIDLNGHKLSRNLNEHGSDGHVIYVHGGSNLTLTSSVAGGSIEGGKANNGGAINIPHGNTVSATNVIFQNNSADQHAGAIWNNGSFEAENCVFENNRASDVGAIYNAVQTENNVTYSGTATLKGCTFRDNVGTAGAGALANALGATVMTIEGGTIENNIADTYGAGIWNGGTLKMKGAIKVKDNTNAGGTVSNVYLKTGKVITVTGSLAGSSIGVDMESTSGVFTSGYNSYNSGVAPETFFTADHSSIMDVIQNGDEAELASWYPNPLSYIERSWDSANKKVVSTEKVLTILIAYDDIPHMESDYKEVTNAPSDEPNQWFRMGGYSNSNSVAEYYVVRGNVYRQTIVVQGNDVHLVLCDGATLTLTGGLKLEGDNKLYIHSQSYGGAMGRLMVTNSYKNAAGIGSARDNGVANAAGELVIYGGHVEAEGGGFAPGIGACSSGNHENLCNKVTVYGGYVEATGGEHAAGIGGGYEGPGGDFILYDGTVIANGGVGVIIYASDYVSVGAPIGGGAGVGGGGVTGWEANKYAGFGGNVTIYGGTLTATGYGSAAGIGSGSALKNNKTDQLCGGTFTIYGGTVTAIGDVDAAGIGGGSRNGGAEVYVYGGTVTAIGYAGGAGIGGGYAGDGGNVSITGGKVIAKGGDGSRAIGPGNGNSQYGTLTIGDAMMVGAGNNGSVEHIFDANERVNGCWYRFYAEISPCTHTGATYTIDGTDANGTHTMHCSHCITTFQAEPHDFDERGVCRACNYSGTTYRVYVWLPEADEDGIYEKDGIYTSYVYDMVDGTSFTLPGAPQDLQDLDFAGWSVGIPEGSTSYKASDSETLLPEKAPYTLEGEVNFVARYKDIVISLADDGDNSETLYTYNGRKAASVTLAGRTLTKNNEWNTLCLPFSLDSFTDTPLDGATVKEMDNSESGTNLSDDGVLTLKFKKANSIEAGKPYIVKWTSGEDISNPVFNGVTITSTEPTGVTTYDGKVTFEGQYSPFIIDEDNKEEILFVSSGNQIGYVSENATLPRVLKNFRAHFWAQPNQGNQGSTASARAINIIFDDMGVTTDLHQVTSDKSQVISDEWYTIDGRKLNGKPAKKGVYIQNGKKTSHP